MKTCILHEKTEDGSGASTSQGMPEITSKSPEARKSQGRFPTNFRGSMVLLTS